MSQVFCIVQHGSHKCYVYQPAAANQFVQLMYSHINGWWNHYMRGLAGFLPHASRECTSSQSKMIKTTFQVFESDSKSLQSTGKMTSHSVGPPQRNTCILVVHHSVSVSTCKLQSGTRAGTADYSNLRTQPHNQFRPVTPSS